jgi:hypothetical protein
VTYGPRTIEKNLVRGDNIVYRVTVKPPSTGNIPTPDPIDLTGSSFRFTMKAEPEENKLQQPTPPRVVKTSDDASEIEIADQTVAETRGQLLIKLDSHDTKWLPAGRYVFDVKMYTATGAQYTVAVGKIFLRAAVGAAEDLTPP